MYGYVTTSNLWDRYGFTTQTQLQRFSVALTELRGRGRMWTIQGHEAFENVQGHGGRHCPPLPQAMRIKNKVVLRVGVPSMQDLQEWATQSKSSEDYKQLTLETFEAAPQWLATKAVSWWQVSRTSVQLGEPNGNDGTWTMTGTKCAAIKRLISIMRSGDKK